MAGNNYYEENCKKATKKLEETLNSINKLTKSEKEEILLNVDTIEKTARAAEASKAVTTQSVK